MAQKEMSKLDLRLKGMYIVYCIILILLYLHSLNEDVNSADNSLTVSLNVTAEADVFVQS